MADENSKTLGAPAPPTPAPPDPAPTLDEAFEADPAAAEPAPAGGTADVGSAGEVVDFKFTQTQRDLAFLLVRILIGVIAVILVVSVTYSIDCWRNADDVGEPCGSAGAALTLLTNSLSPIFTAMIGLVGSVVGFYFGSKKT